MEENNVVFELQISKQLLEQILNENQDLKQKYDAYQQSPKNFSQKTSLKAVINLVKEDQRGSEEDPTSYQPLTFHISESEFKTETGPQISELEETVSRLEEELKTTNASLDAVRKENQDLDVSNLALEGQVDKLNRKLRLEEERNKSSDLANVECKLLKLKLQSIQNEKAYLLEEFEKERKIITKQHKPRVAKFEENIKHLRKWIETEARERRPHDTEEVKALKAKIHTLEHDKSDLIEGFEMERKVFQKIIKSNNMYTQLS